MTFPDHAYVSLEDLDSRTLATDDPRTFLRRYPSPVIIDEVQRVPELLSYIQGLIDENPDKKGLVYSGESGAVAQQIDALNFLDAGACFEI